MCYNIAKIGTIKRFINNIVQNDFQRKVKLSTKFLKVYIKRWKQEKNISFFFLQINAI